MNRGCLAAMTVGVLLLSSGAGAADAERGGSLYANHCTSCHTTAAHFREKRKANTPQALRRWIDRWQWVQSLNWTRDDVEDVAAFLDGRYYKFSPTATQ